MEPLVIVSAAVVLFYGYRSVIDLLRDLRQDGWWEAVQESLAQGRATAASVRERVRRFRSRRIVYYNNFFLDVRKRQPRILLKPHA